ncbi:MAG TPA: hypothetical protein VF406_16125 [Thermodesulfobacteriota bacterium]
MSDTIWLAGRMLTGQPWEILGVYATEAEAVARCRRWEDFVGPLTLGVDLPEETAPWSGCYYPQARAALEGREP